MKKYNATLVTRIVFLITLFKFCFSYKEMSIEMLQHIESLNLTSEFGPESLAFDRSGGGPYTGVSNGRILKWMGKARGWSDFAFNSNTRTRECESSLNITMENICGRPLGLQFHKATGTLYIADAYFGLMAVGPKGGLALRLCNTAKYGGPFRFTNGVDVDQTTGVVYFTDSSTKFTRPDYLLAVLLSDSTGRLMKYDPKTKNVTVLKHDISFPNGVALSEDNTFLLIAQTGECRIIKYWLVGSKAGKTEVFAELPGYPDNIKRTPNGEFWVAINRKKIDLNKPFKDNYGAMVSQQQEQKPIALRLSREGKVVQVINGGMMSSVSEVMEFNGTIWFGSVDVPYVSVYRV